MTAIPVAMTLDPETCYQAVLSRDARFDGRFFTAVRTTGIFCRPVCPVRTPRFENCTFLPSAAAAQAAGFRPCLRCRPEASPGTPAWLGASATVSRGLRLIGEGALDNGGSVEALADRLGVGARHLRRLFSHHLGAAPNAIAVARRVLFAKKLITETSLPMTEVAHAAGFASVRRFNDALRRMYAISPGDLRRRRVAESEITAGAPITLKMAYRPPYDWPAVARYLRGRAIPGVESVTEAGYHRTVQLGAARGRISVSPAGAGAHFNVAVSVDGPANLIDVMERVRRLMDFGADPSAICEHLAADPVLCGAPERLAGMRVPGAWDPFELGVRAILGQQVSVAGASTLAGRLVDRFGGQFDDLNDTVAPYRLFPNPKDLVDADLSAIGLTGARATTIRAFARAVADDDLFADLARDLDDTIARLTSLPGIGPWTAHYIAMRAVREPDAFPETDLGLRRAWRRRTGGNGEDLAAAACRWRPWRAYAAMYLWMYGGRDDGHRG